MVILELEPDLDWGTGRSSRFNFNLIRVDGENWQIIVTKYDA
jgi:hypothetical protein